MKEPEHKSSRPPTDVAFMASGCLVIAGIRCLTGPVGSPCLPAVDPDATRFGPGQRKSSRINQSFIALAVSCAPDLRGCPGPSFQLYPGGKGNLDETSDQTGGDTMADLWPAGAVVGLRRRGAVHRGHLRMWQRQHCVSGGQGHDSGPLRAAGTIAVKSAGLNPHAGGAAVRRCSPIASGHRRHSAGARTLPPHRSGPQAVMRGVAPRPEVTQGCPAA